MVPSPGGALDRGSPVTTPSDPIRAVVGEGEPLRLDQALARFCGLSRTRARAVIAAGGARVDGQRVRVASRTVAPGQRIEAFPGAVERARAARSPGLEPRIVWSDRFLAAVSKPAGMPSQPTRETDAGTVEAFLKERFGARVHLPHRLDTPASGLLVAAIHPAAAGPLQDLFTQRRAVRIYRVVVLGTPEPEEAELRHHLAWEGGRRRAVEPGSDPGDQEMALRYRVLDREGDRSLLWVRLLTGRTHQIRLQMAAAGHPVFGDALYGPPEGRAPRLALHAAELTFRHPVLGGRVDVVDAPGPDFPWPRPVAVGGDTDLPASG